MTLTRTQTGSGDFHSLERQQPQRENKERINQLAKFQKEILIHSLTSFPNAVMVSYSTCSIYEQENEEVVSHCLQAQGVAENWELTHALPDWPHRGVQLPEHPHLDHSKLVRAGREDDTGGFFLAIFTRKQTSSRAKPPRLSSSESGKQQKRMRGGDH